MLDELIMKVTGPWYSLEVLNDHFTDGVFQALTLNVVLRDPYIKDIFPIKRHSREMARKLLYDIANEKFNWKQELFYYGFPTTQMSPQVAMLAVRKYLASLQVAVLEPPDAWHSVSHLLTDQRRQPLLAVIPCGFVTSVRPLLENLTERQSLLLEQVIYLMRVIAKDVNDNVNADHLMALARFWAGALARKYSPRNCPRCSPLRIRASSDGVAHVLFTLALWNVRKRVNPFTEVYLVDIKIVPVIIDYIDACVSL